MTRKVRIEARYTALESFWLGKKAEAGGEVIQVVAAPKDETAGKLEALRDQIKQGKSLRQAAEAIGLPRSTASRWLGD